MRVDQDTDGVAQLIARKSLHPSCRRRSSDERSVRCGYHSNQRAAIEFQAHAQSERPIRARLRPRYRIGRAIRGVMLAGRGSFASSTQRIFRVDTLRNFPSTYAAAALRPCFRTRRSGKSRFNHRPGRLGANHREGRPGKEQVERSLIETFNAIVAERANRILDVTPHLATGQSGEAQPIHVILDVKTHVPFQVEYTGKGTLRDGLVCKFNE